VVSALTDARLIGRAAELAALEAALADAAEGHPALAFVAGESGVGKTRLLAELGRRAAGNGALVLAGDCVDLGGEGELPYLPLVAALRPLARVGELTEAVAQLFPGGPAAGEGGQARLFEGLLSLLDSLGQGRPVLLVIEDLHWADCSTRAALAFLAGATAAERVHAHDEAAALFERALSLWPEVPDPESVAGADRVTLLARAADAASALADPGRQLALLEEAFAELGPRPDPLRAAAVLESTARAQRHLTARRRASRRSSARSSWPVTIRRAARACSPPSRAPA
jgi:AAA ATPase domain